MNKSTVFLLIIAILCAILAYLEFSFDEDGGGSDQSIKIDKLQQVKNQSDSLLRTIEFNTQELVEELEAGSIFPEDLDLILKEVTGKGNLIWEVEAAFEPFQFDSDIELFGRGYMLSEDSWFSIPEAYDYRDTFETQAKWYVNTMIYNLPYWSKPYDLKGEANIDLIYPMFYRAGIVAEQLIGVVRLKSRLPMGNVSGYFIIDDALEDVFNPELQSRLGIRSFNEIRSLPQMTSAEVISGSEKGEILIDSLAQRSFIYERSEVLGWTYGTLSEKEVADEKSDMWFYLYIVGAIVSLILALRTLRQQSNRK